MKTAAASLLALAASASAFTSTQVPSRVATAVPAAMDDMVGSVDFRGMEFKWDPLKLSETYEPFLPWFRESELRHGRTAMLAVLGFIATDFVRLPGELYSFASIPKTTDAHDILVEKGPMVQLLLWIGLFDLIITAPACAATMKGEREPGDFGWTRFKPKDDASYKKKQESELMNGRLAMMAVGGIATQSIINGHGFPYI
ncbi:fucoxanthin chlorophyll a/c protein [Nitzschia inconspicua]|uniref:Fucoxanthin chlorophyll a/c protein n=1 Tax=Nitzschia inconspicua TaxID=303405 RepID=A0A9K3LNV0_9STRA|nr:fucoxanthin chlorophyll a/c protein [Nitzschia inconspicua]